MELGDKNDDRFAERLRGMGPLGTLAWSSSLRPILSFASRSFALSEVIWGFGRLSALAKSSTNPLPLVQGSFVIIASEASG